MRKKDKEPQAPKGDVKKGKRRSFHLKGDGLRYSYNLHVLYLMDIKRLLFKIFYSVNGVKNGNKQSKVYIYL